MNDDEEKSDGREGSDIEKTVEHINELILNKNEGVNEN